MINVINNGGRIQETVKLLGTGTIKLGPGAQIRHYSIIEMEDGYLEIGGQSVLGYHTMVQATGTIKIGNNNLIGPQCTLLGSKHPISDDPAVQRTLVRSTLTFGHNIWVGANVVFNHGIVVGDNSVIGANSFVNNNVDKNTIVAGTPAKFIKWKKDATD